MEWFKMDSAWTWNFISRNPHPFGLAVTRSAIFYTDLNTHRLHSFMKSDNTTIFDLELDLGSLYSILVIDKNQDCTYNIFNYYTTTSLLHCSL